MAVEVPSVRQASSFRSVEIRVAVGSWYRELGRSHGAFHLGVSGMAPGVLAHRACDCDAAGSGVSSRRMERRQLGSLRSRSGSTSRLHRNGTSRVARRWSGPRGSVTQIAGLPCHSPRRIFFSILSGMGCDGTLSAWASRRGSPEEANLERCAAAKLDELASPRSRSRGTRIGRRPIHI